MTFIIRLVIVLAGLCCAQAQNFASPEWKAVVKVVDEAGQPVEGANVTVGYYVTPPSGDPTRIATDAKRGATDTNGVFSTSGRGGSTDLFFGASKEGYYHSHLEHEFTKFKANDPAKWNPNVTLLLKRVGKPTPMYARGVNLGVPAFDKTVGFDLALGDWVAPYGKGSHDDIHFNAHIDKRARYDYDYTLTVSFPEPGDGIQEFNVTEFPGGGSDLRSSHEAPVDGYRPQWVQTKSARPKLGYSGNWDENRNYYFRVRTVLDEKGHVKSALYGKIYGDFMQFRYFLNPTSNDRNVEFDPKQNLFGKDMDGGVTMNMP
jgi:hypothetical protein